MRKRADGFTLVELMVVVLVIGILVAVAVPVYTSAKAKAQASTCAANVRTIESTEQQYKIDTGALPATLASLAPSYVKKTPVCPTGGTYWISYLSGNGSPWCSKHSASMSWSGANTSWITHQHNGPWTSQGGWITYTGNNASFSDAFFGDPTLADYRLMVTMRGAGNGTYSEYSEGVYFRYHTDADGELWCYLLRPNNSGSEFAVHRQGSSGGAWRVATVSVPDYAPSAEHTIDLTMREETVEFRLDGTLRATWTLSDSLYGCAGFYRAPGSTVQFGSVTITPL